MLIKVYIPDDEVASVLAVGANDFREAFFPKIGLHPTKVVLSHIEPEEIEKRNIGKAYDYFNDVSVAPGQEGADS